MDISKMKAGDHHYMAYVGPPTQYDYVGAMWFRLLCTSGLRAHHSLLDFDCGSLRAKQGVIMNIKFTAHNIRLDNGTYTKPDEKYTMENYPWFVSAKRILEAVFPGDKSRYRLADLGCLEGGYATEFARMDFNVLGLEVRKNNIAACQYVKDHVNLPNLDFAQDNVWNISSYGNFDVIFCCGLLYHLNKPKKLLEILSSITSKLIIIQTHFSTITTGSMNLVPRFVPKRLWRRLKIPMTGNEKFRLSRVTENEHLKGCWYTEFKDRAAFNKREKSKWASWDNMKSFWIQREYLLQAIQDVGFDLVLEQYDSLGPNIAKEMLSGYYKINSRGTFIGIKT